MRHAEGRAEAFEEAEKIAEAALGNEWLSESERGVVRGIAAALRARAKELAADLEAKAKEES